MKEKMPRCNDVAPAYFIFGRRRERLSHHKSANVRVCERPKCCSFSQATIDQRNLAAVWFQLSINRRSEVRGTSISMVVARRFVRNLSSIVLLVSAQKIRQSRGGRITSTGHIMKKESDGKDVKFVGAKHEVIFGAWGGLISWEECVTWDAKSRSVYGLSYSFFVSLVSQEPSSLE